LFCSAALFFWRKEQDGWKSGAAFWQTPAASARTFIFIFILRLEGFYIAPLALSSKKPAITH
jgi:hypothetical protein